MKSVVSEASRRFKISSDERLVTVQFWREEDVDLLVALMLEKRIPHLTFRGAPNNPRFFSLFFSRALEQNALRHVTRLKVLGVATVQKHVASFYHAIQNMPLLTTLAIRSSNAFMEYDVIECLVQSPPLDVAELELSHLRGQCPPEQVTRLLLAFPRLTSLSMEGDVLDKTFRDAEDQARVLHATILAHKGLMRFVHTEKSMFPESVLAQISDHLKSNVIRNRLGQRECALATIAFLFCWQHRHSESDLRVLDRYGAQTIAHLIYATRFDSEWTLKTGVPDDYWQRENEKLVKGNAKSGSSK